MTTHPIPPVAAVSPQAPSSLPAVPSSHPPVSPFLIPCLLLRQGHHRSASVVPPLSSAPSEVIVVGSGPPGVRSTMPTVTPLLGRVDADLTPPQPSARSAPLPSGRRIWTLLHRVQPSRATSARASSAASSPRRASLRWRLRALLTPGPNLVIISPIHLPPWCRSSL
jgi:hypothetical protein